MGDLLITWIALLSCSVGVTSNVTRWESVGDLTEDNCYKLRQETGVTCWQQASGTWAPLWTPFNDELAEVWLTAVLLLRSWSHWFVSKRILFVSMKTKQSVFGHWNTSETRLRVERKTIGTHRETLFDILSAGTTSGVCLSVCLSAEQSVCLPVCMSACLSTRLLCLPDCLSLSLFVWFFGHRSACLSVSLPVCLFVCLSACLSICLSVCLSICLSVWLFVCPEVSLSASLPKCLSAWLSVRLCWFFAFWIRSVCTKHMYCLTGARPVRPIRPRPRLPPGRGKYLVLERIWYYYYYYTINIQSNTPFHLFLIHLPNGRPIKVTSDPAERMKQRANELMEGRRNESTNERTNERTKEPNNE